MKACETVLPENYNEVYHIDAKSKKTGILLNLCSFIPVIGILVLFACTVSPAEFGFEELSDFPKLLLFFVGLLFGIFAYVVLHVLTHGVVYKLLTKQKLTFGLSWSCAYCGIPNVYVYRKTAILALIAPFALFTLILLPLTIVFAFINVYLYIIFGFVFAMHFGGCSGDLYMFFLLLFKYKNPALLLRDSGPEQWLYLPENI